jgi:allantoinase
VIVVNGMVALSGRDAPVRADLRIEGGRIAEIAIVTGSLESGSGLRPAPGEQLIDATGLLVLPGAIDPHVHFDTPGFESRETFLRGSAEAARGGVTTVIDMPCTSLPPVVDAAALENKLAAVAPMALVDYGFYGGVRGGTEGEELERGMEEIADRVLGYKCYLLSGMETFPQVNHMELGRALASAAALGRPLALHAEDANYCAAARKRVEAARTHAATMASGGGSAATWDDYVDSRPEEAERIACAVAAELAVAKGCPGTLHVVHVGVAAAAEALARAGATSETCTHYLAFTREDFAVHGAALKTAPPVKSKLERERLWALLADGTISYVTSDHAPASRREKRTGSVWTDYGGIPGTGTLLPYLLSEGYLAGRLSLARFLEAVSSAAAARFGIDDRKGSIAVGKDADFVLVDTAAKTTVSGSRLYSKGRDTPFEGLTLKGAIRATYVRGGLVYDSAEDASPADSLDSDYAEAPAAAKTTEAGLRASFEEELAEMAPGIVAAHGSGRFITRRLA